MKRVMFSAALKTTSKIRQAGKKFAIFDRKNPKIIRL